MAGFNFSQYAVGGAQRPDSFSGMQPQFQSALANMFSGAPEDIRANLRVGSGFRSPERQAQLWSQALQKYGSPEAARKWVAPPGNSQHNHGSAADLKFLNDGARQWAHDNAGQFGLAFPLANENWHIELAGARGGHPASAAQPASPDVMVARAGGSPLSAMFTAPGEAPVTAPGMADAVPGMADAPGGVGNLALLFAQQQQAKQQQRADDQEAEQVRRQALFSSNSLAGLFGAA